MRTLKIGAERKKADMRVNGKKYWLTQDNMSDSRRLSIVLY
ncbi:MAG: hypothetical protein ACJATV_000507 [Granulosicoccus sp.]|jgi:hypothetical protein